MQDMATVFGPGKGMWAFQSDCSFSTVIWLTNCRMYKLNRCPAPVQPCWPTRSEICISIAVLAHTLRAGQTKETVQIHQTLFLVRGKVWARDYCSTSQTNNTLLRLSHIHSLIMQIDTLALPQCLFAQPPRVCVITSVVCSLSIT